MKMMQIVTFLCGAMLWVSDSQAAVDSYRYLHVTVETPWTIFLFLLVGILAPFLLMGVLIWRFAGRKSELENSAATVDETKE